MSKFTLWHHHLHASSLSESVEYSRHSEVWRGTTPDGADGGHSCHDLDRLWAVGDVPGDPVPLGDPVGPEGSSGEGDPPPELPECLGLQPDLLKGMIYSK